MESAYMQGYSEPKVDSELLPAEQFINDVDYSEVPGFAEIDYAGGGVRATLDDYLTFMTALVNHELVSSETLNTMLSDDAPSMLGMRYGYGIWKFVTVLIVAPAKFNCWGCVGVTGAFMFFHRRTESYVIGTFNDMDYKSKALRFMLAKVINQLQKCE
jgi:D-alanyl-D-alanine carboxypeptidase